MKKIFFALAIALLAGLALSSCKSKEKCEAYSSSAPAHHKTVNY